MPTLRALAILAALLASPALAAAQVDEYGLKTAFVANFVQFVDWPSAQLTPTGALTVCTLGQSAVGERLRTLDGGLVNHRAVAVRKVAAQDELSTCRVLFVPMTESDRVPEILRRHPGAGILIISERSDLSVSQAVIDLVVVDKRVTFDIDLDVARRQQLMVSSKLVKLARYVRGAAKGGRD